jgi:hypothetical protein
LRHESLIFGSPVIDDREIAEAVATLDDVLGALREVLET